MQSFTGQCQCGAVRYTVTGKQVAAFVCHCTDCQRQSASAFGMAAWIAEAEVQVEQGNLQEWIRHTPSGKQMVCRFCGVCGSRLIHQVLGSGYLSIKPGSLDDPSQCQPIAHIWTRSKQPWIDIPLGMLQFEGNPESMDSLVQAWELAHTKKH
jgi:hypothetical protein